MLNASAQQRGCSVIEVHDGVFFLTTARTSYWFALTEAGHLEHLHYGPRLTPQDPAALRAKRTNMTGSTVAYDPSDLTYSLDTLSLEFSSPGRGDYRHLPIAVRTATGFDLDLTYVSHEIAAGTVASDLPIADDDGACSSLIVRLADPTAGFEVDLMYTVYEETDVIARRVRLRNTGTAAVEITRALSMQLDLPDRGYEIRSFSGAWIAEAHAYSRPATPGIFSVGSTTGASSNRHNPGFFLSVDAGEDHGEVFGFNLVYSGNHLGTVEVQARGLVRVSTGINPEFFTWLLAPGESFDTPQAVLTYSNAGFNQASANFHAFIRSSITPEGYRERLRPIVFNSWEATGFDVNEKRLSNLAKQAASLGMEMFVIDDGWFRGRKDDTAGLGDYEVDTRKFPAGLASFARKITALGMEAGIWVEPEMVNPDSNLYRTHPDWAMVVPGKEPLLGRHQLLLDLCNPAVQDYIVDQVGALLDSGPFTYVKWDMNRHMSDLYSAHVPHPGMVAHTYVLALYDVLERIFSPRPHVMLEMCSSGGNRFDLGMLRYAAMIWASDDTDPIERLEIQQGLGYLYPQSVISAHVSAAPHEQTLRPTPLSTRFNVAAMACLGYEYDLDLLTRAERKEIREQIEFYTRHRELLQFGALRRLPIREPDRYRWMISGENSAIVGNFQRRVDAAPAPEILPIPGLDPESRYRVESKPQRIAIERLGHLVKHVSPVRLDPRGSVMRAVNTFHSLPDAAENYEGTGALLAAGIRLHNQFRGTYYTPETRILGDYGSTLYTVTKLSSEDQ